MIKYHTGDVFELIRSQKKSDPHVVFPHVVNIHNAFGAGLAYAFSKKFPIVKEEYHKFYNDYSFADDFLDEDLYGRVGYVPVTPTFTVANMFAQTLGGKLPLSYSALEDCIADVRDHIIASNRRTQIITVKFGAGLARGDWNVIEAIINGYWSDFPVTVCSPKE